MTFYTKLGQAIFGAASLVAIAAAPAAAQTVDIGTMSQGTISYSVGSAIAQVLAANGVSASVQPNSGETTIMPLVNSAELDMGIASVGEVANAVEGAGVFENRAQENMLALAALFPLKVGIFVRADSDIETIGDLAGRRVTTDFAAMGVINDILLASLANGGLSASDVVPVNVPNVAAGADDFIAGRADAFFFGLGAAKVLEADASVGGLRMLPLDNSPEAVARMTEVFEPGYLVEQQPGNTTPGFTEPTSVMTYDNILLVNAGVPDETVANVTRVLAESQPQLAASFPPFNDFEPADMHKDLPIAYHPGALQYYEAAGL